MFPIGEISLAQVQEYIKSLISEGKITNKQIQEYKFRAEEEVRQQLVLNGLKKGLSRREMIISDESGCLTETKVKVTKKKLIENGAITEDQIESAKKERHLKEAKEKENLEKRWGQHICKAQKIIDLDSTYSQNFFDESIKDAQGRYEAGILNIQDLNILSEATLIEKPTLRSIAEISKLYIGIGRSDLCIRFLNLSRDHFEGKEYEKLSLLITTVNSYIKNNSTTKKTKNKTDKNVSTVYYKNNLLLETEEER